MKCKEIGEIANYNNKIFKLYYANLAVNTIANINPNSIVGNKCLLDRYHKDDNFLPHHLVTLKSNEIYPERWQTYIEHVNKTNEILEKAKEKSYTNQFLCPKCNNRKATFVEVMTRSADEPMTLFVTCAICNYKFKR